MTLCMAWRSNGTVHFASDSRLKVGTNSYADVGIKVLSIPFTVLDPLMSGSSDPPNITFTGEIGMCFAGSAVNSLTIKESVVEVLKGLQHAPSFTDISMAGLANFVFIAYRMISHKVCETALGPNGRASILIAGMCHDLKRIRVFHLATDALNNHSMCEVLTDRDHEFIGSGSDAAEHDLPQSRLDADYFSVLRSVIEDVRIPSVGGHIQYGCFIDSRFVVYGLVELGEDVHYWRGALDLNSKEFIGDVESFVPNFPHIDPFSPFGGA